MNDIGLQKSGNRFHAEQKGIRKHVSTEGMG
jgi:hypothetical protein